MNWKKPWTIIAWIFGHEQFEAEEGRGPGPVSRFGKRGFWGWLFGSEGEFFREEPVRDVSSSRFEEGGFWKWLFAGEEFGEEPEIRIHEPLYGGRTFFGWLFSSEGESSEETESEQREYKD